MTTNAELQEEIATLKSEIAELKALLFPTETKDLLTKYVYYVASDGKRKIALVTGTPEFITESSSAVHPLVAGQLHLEIHSPSGKIYARQTVDKKTAENQTNVWEPLTS